MIANPNSVSITVTLDSVDAEKRAKDFAGAIEALEKQLGGLKKGFGEFETRIRGMGQQMKIAGDATKNFFKIFTSVKRIDSVTASMDRINVQMGRLKLATEGAATGMGNFQTRAQSSTKLVEQYLNEVKKSAEETRKAIDSLSRIRRLPTQRASTRSISTPNIGGLAAALPVPAKTQSSWAQFTRTLGASRTLLAGLGVGFSLFAVTNQVIQATTAFINFERKMREVNTILRLSQDDFVKMTNVIRRLSVEIGKSPIDLATAQYSIASAGFTDASDSLKILTTSTKLGIAGIASTEEAFLALNAALQPFSINIENADIVASKLFRTVELGLTTIPQLASNLNKVTQNARNTGVSLEETLASISTITVTTSATTDVATTSIRALFNEISSKAAVASAASEKFRSLGVNLNQYFGGDAVKNSGSLVDNLQGIVVELNKMNATARSTTLAQLFGIEAQTAFYSLTKNADTFRRHLGEISNASSEAQVAYEEMNKSAYRAVERLRSSFEVARTLFGEQLVKQIERLGYGTEGVGQAFIDIAKYASYASGILIPFFANIIERIKTFVQIVKDLFVFIGNNLSTIFSEIEAKVHDLNVKILKVLQAGNFFGGADYTAAIDEATRNADLARAAAKISANEAAKSFDALAKSSLNFLSAFTGQSVGSIVAFFEDIGVGADTLRAKFTDKELAAHGMYARIVENFGGVTADFAAYANTFIESNKNLKKELSSGGEGTPFETLAFTFTPEQQTEIDEFYKAFIDSETASFDKRIDIAREYYKAQYEAARFNINTIFDEEAKKNAEVQKFIQLFEEESLAQKTSNIDRLFQKERAKMLEYYQFIRANDDASTLDRIDAIQELGKLEKDRIEKQFFDGKINATQLATLTSILNKGLFKEAGDLQRADFERQKGLMNELNQLRLENPQTSAGDKIGIKTQNTEDQIAEFRRQAELLGLEQDKVNEFERLKRIELEQEIGRIRIEELKKANFLYQTQIGGQLAAIQADAGKGTSDLLSGEAVQTLDSAFSSLKGTMTSAFADAISGAKSFQEIMQDVGKAVIQVIIQIIAQILTAIAVALVLNALGFGVPAAAGTGATALDLGSASGEVGTSAIPIGGLGLQSSRQTSLIPDRPQSNFAYSQTSVNISAVDAESFRNYMDANPEAISGAMSYNLSNSSSVQRSAGLI
jgi:TP901 family phage tail tape measure protein